MNISVLGCGRWGSFLSWYVSNLGHKTLLYGREDSRSFINLQQRRANEYVKLNPDIELCSDLSKCIAHADTLIISISAQEFRKFIRKITSMSSLKDKTVILCMKGLEHSSCKRLSEIAIEEGVTKQNICVWLGPGHIQDFTRGIPNCMTIDSYNPQLTIDISNALGSDLIRFYYGDDIIGNEIGAACKNIMGIAAGILDGLGFTSLKGPLMSRGAYEVSKFIAAMGGKRDTAYGLTHLGDYETTLFSPYSNNRKYGEQLARNLAFEKLAEGVSTTQAVTTKAQALGVEMPITFAINNVLYNGADIKSEMDNLFRRSLKRELRYD